jgi:polysaccharide biosynthesis transport protein
MKQEIQVTARTPAVADYWTQGQSAVGAPSGSSGPPAQPPLKRIHRLLRGRYPLAMFLVMVGGLAGAMAGFVLLEPKFQSEGLLKVDPAISTGGPIEGTLNMIGMTMQGLTTIIMSPGVAEQALNDPEFVAAWKKAYPNVDMMSSVDFALALTAEHEKNSFNIKVTFVDKSPAVAKAGTRAAIRAYVAKYGDIGELDRKKSIEFDQKQMDDAIKDLGIQNANLAKYAKEFGTNDLTALQMATQTELDRLDTNLAAAQVALETAQAAQGAPPTAAVSRDMLIEIAAQNDMIMRRDYNQWVRDKTTLDDLQGSSVGYGPNYPPLKSALGRVNVDNATIDKDLVDYQTRTAQRPVAGTIDPSSPAALTLAKTTVEQLKTAYAKQLDKADHILDVQNEMAKARAQITTDNDDIGIQRTRIGTLNAEQALTKNIEVIEPGADAQPAGNKRPIAAVIGFILGGAIPLGLLMLYGMVDHRFRYSDDATHAELGGVALLGILPNLPDRLSDPQQAGIAAHCVHQIRTMLQISRNNDEPQILAVTSAAPADGKTSLTLALGLSYAACGARTLLIDCDLIGAGLSHRLNVHAPEGMLEAVANRALLEYVLTTDIADVALLPVGTAHAHHASTLSPVALRRLLSEAKKHFDIVLVDTGPILGSIEASLVCAAADRTILTVARGQQRPLVERSIGHLQAIGARLAGVVFNRAQPRDFEKSLSGLALRSRPMNGNGASVAGPSVTGPVVTPPNKSSPGSFKRAV